MAEGVGTVEAHGIAPIEDPPTQRVLEQADPHRRDRARGVVVPPALARPSRFDGADPFDDHAIVIAMGSAMQRQAEPQGCARPGRKQHAVAAEVVEADLLAPQGLEQGLEYGPLDCLAWNEMMAL